MEDLNILRILYEKRVRLILVSLAVGVVVAALSLLSPNRYSSTAAVGVQQPEVPITGEISPLRVEVLRSLVESARVKRMLYDRLREEGLMDDRIDFARLQRMLSTQVQAAEARERFLLPMVRLTATTRDPELSMVIANRWAEAVLDTTRDVYRSGVGELGDFIEGMYDQVNRSLIESEERFTEVRLKANLAVRREALSERRSSHKNHLQSLRDLQSRLAIESAVLEGLEKAIAEREIDGIWIGDYFQRELRENPDYQPTKSTPLARRICRFVRSYLENTEALSEFRETSRIDQKKMMVEVKEAAIRDLSREIRNARLELARAEATRQSLEGSLSGIQPKIVLNKAIADEAIWAKYLDRRIPDLSTLPSMLTEINNLVYQETEKELVILTGKTSGLRSKVAESEKEWDRLRQEVGKLRRDIDGLETEKNRFRRRIGDARALLDHYEANHAAQRRLFEEKEIELAVIRSRAEATEAELKKSEAEIAGLEETVYTNEDILNRLKRDVSNLATIRESLGSRAEEVALLRVSMEDASRSGTFLLYRAEADPIKAGPRRARIVLGAVFLVFVIYSLALVLLAAASVPPGRSPEG